jgi:uncharacterized protein YbjT (DUF2867 family)
MKVLVVGASGKYAGFVVPELIKRGATVRALIRDRKKADEVRNRGASETAIGDLSDPESLRSAASGVDGVFHINPAFAPNESELGVAMVEAAKAAGVRKFVFSGVYHPSLSRMVNHRSKLPVEEALYQSGLEFTNLQPAMFMQTLDLGWKATLASGKLSLPYSKTAKACYVDYRDVAEAAAIALTSDKLAYGTFELAAPGMVDRVELAALMSETLGRTIEAAEPSFDEWADAAKEPPGPRREGLKKMYANYDQFGFPGGNALVLRAVLERQQRTLREYVREFAGRS